MINLSPGSIKILEVSYIISQNIELALGNSELSPKVTLIRTSKPFNDVLTIPIERFRAAPRTNYQAKIFISGIQAENS